jgi:hypothetical protein
MYGCACGRAICSVGFFFFFFFSFLLLHASIMYHSRPLPTIFSFVSTYDREWLVPAPVRAAGEFAAFAGVLLLLWQLSRSRVHAEPTMAEHRGAAAGGTRPGVHPKSD